jgi:hypothetical protein
VLSGAIEQVTSAISGEPESNLEWIKPLEITDNCYCLWARLEGLYSRLIGHVLVDLYAIEREPCITAILQLQLELPFYLSALGALSGATSQYRLPPS